MFFYLITFSIYIADQLIKYFVQAGMLPGASLPVIGKLLKMTYVRNTGAAFSLFTGFSLYLAIMGLAVVAVLFYFHFRASRKDYFLQTALSFILGGSLGNLSDRILRGYVVDYVDFGFWPVFNLADVMINVGVALLFLQFIRRGGKDASDII